MNWLNLIGVSYQQYRQAMSEMAEYGVTSGPVQSEALIGFSKLNEARMSRLDKQIEKNGTTTDDSSGNIKNQTWIVLTETWCGDAAQNIPWLEAIARTHRGITTRYVLRDFNPDLMDQFLTNGSRSIPKLISVDDHGDVLFTWGPRPREAQDLMMKLKKEGVPKSESGKAIQLWYAKDKGVSVTTELNQLISETSA
jgi:hypothetical protein